MAIYLQNYPTATPAVVNFKIRVDPCVVTTLTPPSAFSFSYSIGAGP